MANRLLTINIRDYLVRTPVRKRHMRISNYIKSRIAKSTNVRTGNIKINNDLNALILTKYLKSMGKLKVNVNIEKDKATVTAFSEKAAVPKPAATSKEQPKGATAAPTTKATATDVNAAAQQKPAASQSQAPKKEASKEAKN